MQYQLVKQIKSHRVKNHLSLRRASLLIEEEMAQLYKNEKGL